MRKLIFLLVLVLALPAAAVEVSTPLAVTLQAAPLDTVQTVSFGLLDRRWLAMDDAIREEQGLPLRYAIPQPVRLTPSGSGNWEKLRGGLWLWRLRIRAAGAASLNLGFTRFRLPAGARLQIYSADLTQIVRPFNAEDNEEHGELWTPAVPTDDLVVELTAPESVRDEIELELGQIGQGYRSFGASGVDNPKSGSCNMDVACLNSNDPWRQTLRAVARLSIGGFGLCTGSLVNDTARDRKMYFITAHHCGVDSSTAASVVVYWNYQSPTCRTPGSPESGGPGGGQLNQFQTGAFLRADIVDSDFTLIELDDPADPAFNLHWAGWDRSTGDVACASGFCYQCSPSTLCAGIHHPNGNEKRITFSERPIEPMPGDDTHLWVHWDPTPVFPPNPALTIPPQVTEPGSSGSPLYNKDRRFVGQLHGGPSVCGATGDNLSDYYGRLNTSWSVAAPYLDPGNTGELFIDGRDYTLANLLFADGFESGATTAWSATAP